jgi:OOP family OmpA-OmpF porin
MKGKRGSEQSISELYALLLPEEKRQLDAVLDLVAREGRLTPEYLGELLPQAVAERAKRDKILAESFVRPTTDAIGISIKRDPDTLSNHLFPIIGALIRKALAAYFQSVAESLDRGIQKGLSFERLRLRIESRRLGVPYYELLVARTLEYKVEQVFLIHAKSGILLQHVYAEDMGGVDSDQVSAMLVAIRDFAKDSLGPDRADGATGGDDSLSAIDMGDRRVLIEDGPQALLAAVARGSATATLRERLQESLELVHFKFGDELESFGGDTGAFDEARPILESCLRSESKASARRPPAFARTLACVLGAALLAFIGLSIGWSIQAASAARAYAATPGIAVTDYARQGSRVTIRGLADPLAAPPKIERSSVFGIEIRTALKPFISLDPAIAAARAARGYAAPESIPLGYGAGGPTPSGAAATIASISIAFAPDSAVLVGQADALERVASAFASLSKESAARGLSPLLAIIGRQYEGAAGNADLRLARALAVERRLVELGVGAGEMEARSGEATGEAPSSTQAASARRVDFRIEYRSRTAASGAR